MKINFHSQVSHRVSVLSSLDGIKRRFLVPSKYSKTHQKEDSHQILDRYFLSSFSTARMYHSLSCPVRKLTQGLFPLVTSFPRFFYASM